MPYAGGEYFPLRSRTGRFATVAQIDAEYRARVREGAAAALEGAIRFAVVQARQAAAQAAEAASRSAIDFAESFANGVRASGPQRAATNQRIANEAAAATVVAYEAARAASHRAGVAPYRVFSRYADGALLRALKDPAFAVGDAEGISFANTAVLRSSARQWARLNFGAGDAGGGGGVQSAISGLGGAALGLDVAPRPAFLMPRGFWKPRGGVGGFGPTGKTLLFPTKGIKAEHWLDAGVAVIAREVVDGYTSIYREMFDHATENGRATASSFVLRTSTFY